LFLVKKTIKNKKNKKEAKQADHMIANHTISLPFKKNIRKNFWFVAPTVAANSTDIRYIEII